MKIQDAIYTINGFDITYGHALVAFIGFMATGVFKAIKFQAKIAFNMTIIILFIYMIATNLPQ